MRIGRLNVYTVLGLIPGNDTGGRSSALRAWSLADAYEYSGIKITNDGGRGYY